MLGGLHKALEENTTETIASDLLNQQGAGCEAEGCRRAVHTSQRCAPAVRQPLGERRCGRP